MEIIHAIVSIHNYFTYVGSAKIEYAACLSSFQDKIFCISSIISSSSIGLLRARLLTHRTKKYMCFSKYMCF